MIKFKSILLIVFAVIITQSCSDTSTKSDKEKFIDNLISQMTLAEKVGQMTLYSSGEDPTVPVFNPKFREEIQKGGAGAIFASISMDSIKYLQGLAMKSRLKIPMLFGYDVVHGYKTIFPIPLAETASWDMKMLEKTAAVAADEASASGINWVFAPMVDLARDARWGRVSEGAGEDPYLGGLAAKARVKGFQGSNLKNNNTVAACAKHFAAYGASISGKDYNTVDLSENYLREVYLKPYKSAKDAGVSSMMSAFNEVNGIPATANKKLLTDVLRDEWGFDGFVVSDFASIGELMNHGFAENKEQCAELSINAGLDMDMEASVYKEEIVQPLVDAKKIEISKLNNSVRRILRVKYDLGLFDDPYKYCNEDRAKNKVFTKSNLAIARDMARKSIVLLKNENQLLPLNLSKLKTIALIGPLAKNQADPMGTWIAQGDTTSVVTTYQGLKKQLPKNSKLLYTKGCDIDSDDTSDFKNAIKIAKQSDLILLALGEKGDMSGEAASKGNINLPGVQTKLLETLSKLNKPIVLILTNGRPMTLEKEVKLSNAVLETWILGTTSGDAIADVLTGKYNPSGKLPMTFPRDIGQLPIYYAFKNTGRPSNPDVRYSSRFLDIPSSPLFPFGYGLSYTTFAYSNLKIDKETLSNKDVLTATVNIKNTGDFDGEEVVQLYLRDLIGSVTRPVRELKAYEKIKIKKGETKTIRFEIIPERDLSFVRADLSTGTEDGDFTLFIGGNSDAQLAANFKLKN
ncbi:beta-glucosidase BglX [Flavicella sediminum]|uniref:beta-glucosidase BglX n=1 Tax=Flavicella sediminum TaxID=2585141 RepID=UPI0011245528|nr:beta-glucosidase BglX [Flavicella sediminum]